ncbi:hypothetical protein RUM44_004176 [Polyplax serrata]|uniref:SEP domain-containing protein n=1 Tax=Polyplax serrata TaxID=468196 RepID=A0ABR1B240_POLSC
MAPENAPIFRETGLKRDIGKFIHRNDYLQEKERLLNNFDENKAVRRSKFHKKSLECRKSIKDSKIEDVFLNSEYFKHQSNMSSLSFCSGDNGEHRWTINSTSSEASSRQNNHPHSAGETKSEVAKDKNPKSVKVKTHNCLLKENSQGKTENTIDKILSGKEKVDDDLITLITEQMFLAERELQVTRTHLMETISKLNERDLEIIQLHERLQNFQKVENSKNKNSEGENRTAEEYQRLILASEKLRKQVKDMEEFLNDYGLIWVGDKEPQQNPDFDKIIKNFQKLNSIAAQPKIIQTTLGAKFELPKEISVVLYSNGMLLRGTEFCEYSKTTSRLFLQDVEDGYFPSELQLEYPEGVPFDVTDKRNELYKPQSVVQHFQGKGNRLGSGFEDKPASVVFLEPMKEYKSHGSSTTLLSDSRDKAFSSIKLKPKKRTKFQNDAKNYVYCQSTGSCDRASSVHSIEGTRNQEKLLTLKIRFGKEKTESFVLHAYASDRLSKFHDLLQRKLCERYHDECLLETSSNYVQADFEVHIYGKSPFRLIENLNKYMKDFGIVENCVLNITEI